MPEYDEVADETESYRFALRGKIPLGFDKNPWLSAVIDFLSAHSTLKITGAKEFEEALQKLPAFFQGTGGEDPLGEGFYLKETRRKGVYRVLAEAEGVLTFYGFLGTEEALDRIANSFCGSPYISRGND